MPFRFHSQVLATGSKVYIFTSIIISVFLSLSMWDYDSGKCRQKQIMFIFIILTRVVYNIHVLLHSIAASNLKCIFIFSWNGIIAFRIIDILSVIHNTNVQMKIYGLNFLQCQNNTFNLPHCHMCVYFTFSTTPNLKYTIENFLLYTICVCMLN